MKENSIYWANWLSTQEFLHAINDQVLRLLASDFQASVFATPNQMNVKIPGYSEARIPLNRDAGRFDHENGLELALMFGIASRVGGKIVIAHADGTPVQSIEMMGMYVIRALNLLDPGETHRMLCALGLITPQAALKNAKNAIRLSTDYC